MLFTSYWQDYSSKHPKWNGKATASRQMRPGRDEQRASAREIPWNTPLNSQRGSRGGLLLPCHISPPLPPEILSFSPPGPHRIFLFSLLTSFKCQRILYLEFKGTKTYELLLNTKEFPVNPKRIVMSAQLRQTQEKMKPHRSGGSRDENTPVFRATPQRWRKATNWIWCSTF